MAWIPAGTFTMGSGRFSEERPQREVTVGRFAISQYEITFAEYERFARATGRRVPDSMGMNRNTHPVILVTWEDATRYAAWLSQETGRTYRLPSEAEWEYAAGAGLDSTYWWGFDIKPGMAHCFGCETGLDPRRPTAVGNFEPNPFGLHDMYGNVAEWVQDCWNNSYEGAPADGRAWTEGDCSYRVVRGGSYLSPPPSIRTSRRDRSVPTILMTQSGYEWSGKNEGRISRISYLVSRQFDSLADHFSSLLSTQPTFNYSRNL
jgi:formylglycine-generating enzyme required for sulfatase activity